METLGPTSLMAPMGPLMATFILITATLLLLLWYSSHNLNYWKKRGVTFIKPYPIFGNILESMFKPFHDVELDRYQRYGKIYGHFEGNRALLSVGDLKLLRSILVKDFQTFSGRREFNFGDNALDKAVSILEGEDWKRVRTILTPTFTTGKIKRMSSIFIDCSKTLAKNFKEAAEKGIPIEIKNLYECFTMDVIASAAFSTKIDSHNDPNNVFVKTARDSFLNASAWRFILFFLFPGLMKFLKISLVSRKGMKFFSDVTLQIIEERKRTKQPRNDFLQLLLETEKELSKEGKLDLKDNEEDLVENYGKFEDDVVFKYVVSKRTLSREELVAQCVIFFIAGFAGTAATLSFASYLIAQNPDIQEKLIQELDSALRANDGELTYEAVRDLKYLDNVISETLRIYPPGFRAERKADEDYILGDTGIKIPKGMIVTIPIYAIHRDPELYPEPEKFNPDRFNPEERAKRNPFAYMPFGAGPRHCVAMRFALMEVKFCIACTLSYFRIKKCSQTKEKLEIINAAGGIFPKDVTVQFEIRKDAVKPL